MFADSKGMCSKNKDGKTVGLRICKTNYFDYINGTDNSIFGGWVF